MYKVLIVDKFSIVRSGLLQLLKEEFSAARTTEANSGQQMLDLFDINISYDLIILGENLANIETDRMIRKVKQLNPTSSVLIFADSFSYPDAINYFINGASGYITKLAEKNEIETAIRMQLNREPYISREMMEAIAREKLSSIKDLRSPAKLLRSVSQKSSGPKLSRRQNEIVNHLILGESTTDIARVLNLKLSTVSTHKSKIYLKLGVNNVVALKNLLDREHIKSS